MTPGNRLATLSSHRCQQSCPSRGMSSLWKLTLHSQQHFSDLSNLPPAIASFLFPFRAKLFELDILVDSSFFLSSLSESTFMRVSSSYSTETALARPPMAFLLKSVVNCQSSTSLDYGSIYTADHFSSPWNFFFFFFLASRIAHCLPILWAAPSHSSFLVPPQLPDFLPPECRDPCRAPISIYTHYLGDVIQAHSFNYHPYANDSPNYISSPSLKHKTLNFDILLPIQPFVNI